MNIVIVGDGKVGYALSEQLSQEKHNVTIIDNNLQTLNQSTNALDVLGVYGNGATTTVQMEAGVQDADLLIAATSTDELNMVCCLVARTLGAQRTIARIRNPEYMSQVHFLRKQLGLSLAINPELATARAIARVINFPPAIKVDTFARGQVELVEFSLPDDSPIIGKQLMDLKIRPDVKILICAIERDGEVFIPNGSFVIEKGDRLYITGETRAMSGFLRLIGRMNFRIRSLMIVGGGRLGYYLARMLDDQHLQVKIVEKNLARCEELCELLPHAAIIHGDGSDIDMLESEGLDDIDAFVALTNMDEENLIMSMVASQKQVPKVVVKVNNLNYFSMMEKMGLDTVVSPKMITADEITQYVRGMQNTKGGKVNTLYKMVGGKAEALEFIVEDSTAYLGITLDRMPLKRNLLIAVIVRKGKVIIPHGNDHLEAGDIVIVVSKRDKLSVLNDIFEERPAK